MKNHRQLARRTFVIASAIVTSALLVEPSLATIGTINKADLSGAWQMTLVGNTGCGLTSMLVNFTLNTNGNLTGVVNNATLKLHSPACNETRTGQTFKVLTLASNGSGTANLSCGVGCGWNFNIQVSPDRSTFNIVDVDPANPGNFFAGMAVHQ